ncbi:hypothetical protein Tco_0737043 [Tanacetum coccineum]
MAFSLPHTDSEVEALVQRLINKDKGRQDALLELAFRFEDSCAVRDDLRKAYEKCNDISQESRALIGTFLKESFENDHKLHLSMYGKASRLEKHMGSKLAWLREKYSHHTRESIARLFSASSTLVCNNEISFSAAARESCNSDIRSSLSSVSAQRVSISTSMSSSRAITSFGLSSDILDAGLPSEKVVASG